MDNIMSFDYEKNYEPSKQEIMAVMQACNCNEEQAYKLSKSGKATLIPGVSTLYDLGQYAIDDYIYGEEIFDKADPFNYELIGINVLDNLGSEELSELLDIPYENLYYLDHSKMGGPYYIDNFETDDEYNQFNKNAYKNTVSISDLGKKYVEHLKENHSIRLLKPEELDFIKLGRWMVQNDSYVKTKNGIVDISGIKE